MGKALTDSQVIELFGDPRPVRELAGGRVEPRQEWYEANIVKIALPFANNLQPKTQIILCHKALASRLTAAFEELKAKSLLPCVQSVDGCYVPRRVRWDAAEPLSRHTWGIAIDLNARQFPFGSPRKQHPQLSQALARNGFRCGQKDGGLWQKTLDPMHFEFADPALLAPEAREDDLPAVTIRLPGGRQVAGTVEGGVLYGPVRPIAEALGGVVIWDAEKRRVAILE